MNPLFKAISGVSTPLSSGMNNSAPMMPGTGMNAPQNVLQRAMQLAQSFRNPQQLVQQFFPDAPAEVSGNPEQLIGWLQQTGRVNPQLVQMARQMTGK